MIKVKQINTEFVRPVKLQVGEGEDKRPIKGANLFAEIYAKYFNYRQKEIG